MLESARNICCLARKLLRIYAAWLGLARIFLENELLENAWLEFYFPCSKSPKTAKYDDALQSNLVILKKSTTQHPMP